MPLNRRPSHDSGRGYLIKLLPTYPLPGPSGGRADLSARLSTRKNRGLFSPSPLPASPPVQELRARLAMEHRCQIVGRDR